MAMHEWFQANTVEAGKLVSSLIFTVTAHSIAGFCKQLSSHGVRTKAVCIGEKAAEKASRVLAIDRSGKRGR